MRIVLVSHTHIGGSFVVGSHHLARELVGLGHEVLHLSTSLTLTHLVSRRLDTTERYTIWRAGGRQLENGVHEYVPFSIVPWPIAKYFMKDTGTPYLWSAPTLNRIIPELGFEDIDLLVIDQPKFLGIQCCIRSAKVIYRATDLYAEITGDSSMAEAERLLVSAVDGLIGTSQPVLDHLRAMAPHLPSLLLENGVEFSHFSSANPEPGSRARVQRAIYIGALDERFDWDLIRYSAHQLPLVEFLLVGPTAVEQSAMPNNVKLLGPVSYGNLPGILGQAHIGMLPLNDHPANRGRSPMKLYEYGAAGLKTVARATDELLRRQDQNVLLYSSYDEFVESIRSGLESSNDVAAVSASAAAHGWDAKAKSLLKFSDGLKLT